MVDGMIKEGGDNGEKCRKTAEGRAGAQTATLHSPTSYSTSPRKHLYHFVHACLENGELKPAMKWDVGGIDFFYASTDRAKDSWIWWSDICPLLARASTFHADALQHWLCMTAATLDDVIWLHLRKLLLPFKRHRFPWRSNTQWRF